MVMDGPAQATVTDSLNRTVGPGGVSIPGAEYISSPGDPFKLILIPAPVEGRYEVSVEGYGSGIYELDLLDTFGPPPLRVSDPASEWDSPRSQIEPGASVNFALTYTAGASDPIPLMAETPMISVPLWEAASKVSGRATPGQQVEIFDADSHALLGTATVDADGHFEVGVAPRLAYMQRIYPLSGGVAGVPVTVEQSGNLPAGGVPQPIDNPGKSRIMAGWPSDPRVRSRRADRWVHLGVSETGGNPAARDAIGGCTAIALFMHLTALVASAWKSPILQPPDKSNPPQGLSLQDTFLAQQGAVPDDVSIPHRIQPWPGEREDSLETGAHTVDWLAHEHGHACW